MKIIHDAACTSYEQPGHPERPARITTTVARLQEQKDLPLTWVTPEPRDLEADLLRAHHPAVLTRLTEPKDFDHDTPYFENIAVRARASVAASLDALAAGRAGETVFSLVRPPGHHALRDASMGFCYLNNIAIAALAATATGSKRVAVFDFDVHHGNGTEDIVVNQPGLEFFSVHQHPAYPGTGAQNVGRNCFNYPVSPLATRETYRATLRRALDDLRGYRPDLIAISAGFDAYERDPLGGGPLKVEDFHWLGHSFRALNLPIFSLLEGGYSRDLPELILAYLKGLGGK